MKQFAYAVVQFIPGERQPMELAADDHKIISYHELGGDAFKFRDLLTKHYGKPQRCVFVAYSRRTDKMPFRPMPV